MLACLLNQVVNFPAGLYYMASLKVLIKGRPRQFMEAQQINMFSKWWKKWDALAGLQS